LDKGKWVARGVFNSASRIRCRLYSWRLGEILDHSFWRGRIERAIAWRRQLGLLDPSGACRLVFSEGDSVSGLIVDRYGEHLCVQVTALAIARRLAEIVPILVELTGAKSVTLRSERGGHHAEGITLTDGPYWGQHPDGPVFIDEHGLRYGVDLREGQKTGCYLDQRENRRAVAQYLRGRSVLDLFCYSGGFSMAAVRLGGASQVLGIDGSAKAVALAKANAELNGVGHLRFEQGDAFETLNELSAQGARFGAVILDPPKFARSRQAVQDALRAYHRLNRMAVEVLEPGGILITCSCSGQITRDDFLMMLVGVAQKTGRDIQVIEQRGASADHPVSATCLESEYLKCFVCRVA
jgi:23S rRNA (cytosine1962-C5)-methyltransferase